MLLSVFDNVMIKMSDSTIKMLYYLISVAGFNFSCFSLFLDAILLPMCCKGISMQINYYFDISSLEFPQISVHSRRLQLLLSIQLITTYPRPITHIPSPSFKYCNTILPFNRGLSSCTYNFHPILVQPIGLILNATSTSQITTTDKSADIKQYVTSQLTNLSNQVHNSLASITSNH